MPGSVPLVEVSDDPHALGIGGPYGEGHAGHGAARGRALASVGTEHLPELLVTSLGDEMEVHLAERGQVSVGVVAGESRARVGDLQGVVRNLCGRQGGDPDPSVLVRHRKAGPLAHEVHGLRTRSQHPNRDDRGLQVRPEDAVGVVMPAIDESIEIEDRDG